MPPDEPHPTIANPQRPEVGLPRDVRESESMLAESQRLAKIGSFELDVASRRLTWSHQQFVNFGVAPAPRIDRALVLTRIHPDDLNRHEAVVARAIALGEAFEVGYRVVHPDGKVVDIHTIGRPILDDAGRVAKLVGTSQDVTDRVRLEARLREQCEALERAGELRTNFMNAVAHELRTPLTTILGYAEVLDEVAADALAPAHRLHVGQIQRGARRIEALLNDLLDFACLEAGTFTLRKRPASLGEQVLAAIESLRPQADAARLELTACLGDDGHRPALDPQRIGQVLTNLLANAIKFAPAGTAIRVATHARGDVVRCEVADAGPGIPDADRDRLFRRYSQLDAGLAAGRGSGLGLAISKALVEAHGGAIGVASTPGAGSTFWFELPLRP